MKRTHILAALLVALSLILTGCGTSDYLQSVTLSAAGAEAGGSYNLPGVDTTIQLQVMANYHSGKSVDITNSVTWTVSTVGTLNDDVTQLPTYGPTTTYIDSTGLMSTVEAICTWTDVGNPLPTPPQYNWVIDGYYQVIANYRGMVSNPLGVGVGSATGNAPNGACGPQAST